MYYAKRLESDVVGNQRTYSATPFLGKPALFGQLLVQLALARKLEHQEDTFCVVEISIQPKYVRVPRVQVSCPGDDLHTQTHSPQVLLDFNLTTDLLLDLALDDFRLVETLESNNVLRRAFCSDHVDPTEFSFTQGSTHVKVGQMPLTGGAVTIVPSVS
jgi:hypothetical protein